MINTKTILWATIAVLALALIFSAATCSHYKSKNVALALENQKLDSIVNKYGQIITIQEAVVIRTNDEKEQLKAITDSLFNLTSKQQKQIKDVIAFYKGVTNTIIRDKLVPYKDTTGRKQWQDSLRKQCQQVIDYYEDNYISVPKQATDSTEHFSAVLTVSKEGVTINNLSIPDSQYIRFNVMKGGLFKKDTYGKRHIILNKRIQVQVLHTNPLVHVTGQQSAIYIPPKKARWLEKALLIGAGIGIKTLITK